MAKAAASSRQIQVIEQKIQAGGLGLQQLIASRASDHLMSAQYYELGQNRLTYLNSG